jgi:hypothetical protein
MVQTADFTNPIASSGAEGSPLEHADLREVCVTLAPRFLPCETDRNVFAMAALAMAVSPVVQLTITFVPGLNYGNAILALVLLTLLHPAVAYDAGSLPLVADQSICAVPAGTIATDGLDDVCLLAKTCCPSWTNVPGIATLSSGANVNCGSAVCANIWRMACDRGGTSEVCTGMPLCELTSTTEAYVFIRRSGASHAGHTGFGFRAAPGLYFYGGLENPQDTPLLPGANNGFWMRNGTRNDMFCAMKKPPVGGDTAYDDDYKVFMNGELPNACSATRTAEDVYMLGYSPVMDNSLDTVFHVLTAYGITGIMLPSDQIFPNDWYNSLDPATWTTQHIGTPSGCTSPVVTYTSTPSLMARQSAGCSACNATYPGENCCLLYPDSLTPSCICGVFGDCSQSGSPNNAVFCPHNSGITNTTTPTCTSTTTGTAACPTSITASVKFIVIHKMYVTD